MDPNARIAVIQHVSPENHVEVEKVLSDNV
jgi:hypothetical protein